jgi:DNA repair exonuclease SbcCD ATPase subunit
MAVTRELVWAAADVLDQSGEKPTLASVRKQIGGGSYTTISSAMTEWHARRAAQKAPARDPVPERVAEAAAELAGMVWQAAIEIADGRLQNERAALEEARQQMAAAQGEAAAFADHLSAELEAVKAKVSELAAALELSTAKIATLEAECARERTRAERLDGVADERQKTIKTLEDQLAQVRQEKETEISRLVAAVSARNAP